MSTNDTVKYNDQHTTGMGYLNRARTVNPSQGQPYESVSLTGLGGRVDNPSYTFYDCTSVLGKALEKYVVKGLIPLSVVVIFGFSMFSDTATIYVLPALLMGFVSLALFSVFFLFINLAVK